MKDKFNIILLLVIFIVPVLIYSYIKSPQNQTSNTAEAVTKKPVVIDFYSTMCYECKKLDKVMKTIEPSYKNRIIFKKLNAGSNDPAVQSLVKKYNVNVVPTMVFQDKNGNLVKRTEGCITKEEFDSTLKQLL